MALKARTICVVYGLLLVFVAHVRDTEGWQARGVYKSNDHPGKCVLSKSIILSPGESAKHPGECVQITCVDEKGNALLSGCGAIMPPPHCNFGDYIDKEAPYSECCEQHLICDDTMNETEVADYQSHIHAMLKGYDTPQADSC